MPVSRQFETVNFYIVNHILSTFVFNICFFFFLCHLEELKVCAFSCINEMHTHHTPEGTSSQCDHEITWLQPLWDRVCMPFMWSVSGQQITKDRIAVVKLISLMTYEKMLTRRKHKKHGQLII